MTQVKQMRKEELAARLNGREYGAEITEAEEFQAKQNGLVVIFGYSDDNMELRGAINDEFGCYDGGICAIHTDGLLPSWDELDKSDGESVFENYFKNKKKARYIEAHFGADSCTWFYTTDIPHSMFDIMEDGEVYCRGIVFEIADIEP